MVQNRARACPYRTAAKKSRTTSHRKGVGADDWVSGDEPMTGAQASYLKTLSEQAHDPEPFDQTLTKAEASKRIDALKARLAQKKSA